MNHENDVEGFVLGKIESIKLVRTIAPESGLVDAKDLTESVFKALGVSQIDSVGNFNILRVAAGKLQRKEYQIVDHKIMVYRELQRSDLVGQLY